ncbi:MAG: UDP-N-acetylmuramoyl-L-alanyl-D-glutamate--2,6-diaminopimelate ligase [Gammaproteobacteria bacterium]|nr:UDP-N-acetylmuramoyl-L-alanyl-D-glutamate--2,6-diaminopimelate ligase [Gammaproteobacteria bacterium]
MTGPAAISDLLAGMAAVDGAAPGTVTGLTLDSRRVRPGELFLACPGTRLDGREFIAEAVERGAAAVAYEPDGFEYRGAVPGVPVPGLALRASEIAARFYGRPGDGLFVIGVTGTNGKTSCVHFLAQSLERLGGRPRMIGTLGSGRVGDPDAGGLTTPGPVDLQRLLRRFADDGATHVIMEVSSHALNQGRVSAVAFDAAVFTNLTRDHLDYHADIDDYANAKKSLFDYPSLRFAVVNVDDAVGRQIHEQAAVPVIGFGDQGAVRASRVEVGEGGLGMRIDHPRATLDVSAPLVGRINVANVLAVAAVLLEMGFDSADVENALNRLSPVPGRMELFRSLRGGPTAVVDYAHTPDALERALQSVREHCREALWCVFGCGGDRDRGKRPEMGRIAEKWANRVVVTNDNPRSESPAAIAAEIVAGMSGEPRVVLDRRRAITTALREARAGDWVLVAGKGHETCQIVGDKVAPFDDRQVVSDCLEKAA